MPQIPNKSGDMNSAIQTVLSEKLHTSQRVVADTLVRFKVVACGRRWGKTELAKTILTVKADYLGLRTWWLAPTYQMASQVWRDLKTVMMGATGITISETEHRMDFSSGGMIAIRSTHYPDNLRGEGLDYAVLDEAAFMQPDVWTEVVRPMLLERRGGAMFLSTPFGRNWFWHLYQLGLNPDETEWHSFHFPSWDNPNIDKAEIEAIRRTTSARVFREEYEAEFIEDAGQVFRGIREAATAPTDAAYNPTHRYYGGIDWGRDPDATAIVIMDATTNQMVAIDRFNKIGWDLQRERVVTLAKYWQPAVIWAEANSIGSPMIEALQNEGVPVRPFMTTVRSKAPLIEALSLAIERGDISLLPDEVLLNELASYTLERLPGGGYRYSAPAGLHDDTVISTALSWYGVQNGGLRVDFA